MAIYDHTIATIKKKNIPHKTIQITNEKEDSIIKNLPLYKIVRFFIDLRRKLKKKRNRKNPKVLEKNHKTFKKNLK